KSVLPEVIGEDVAVGCRVVVDQTDLRPEYQLLRNRSIAAFARRGEANQDAPEALKNDLVNVTATVPAVVDDQRLSVHLRVELADELLCAQRLHIGKVDVSDFSARHSVHNRPVLIDPVLLAERKLILYRLDCHIAVVSPTGVDDRERYGLIIQSD